MAETQIVDPVTENPLPDTPREEPSLITPDPTPEVPPKEPKATAENPPWMAQLEGDLKSDKALTKFKTLSELGKSYRELEGRLGKAIVPPGEGATAEEIAAFHKKMGRPDKPEDYALENKLPKEVLSEEMLTGFKAKAHELGLSQKAAADMFTWYSSKVGEQYNAMIQAQNNKVKFAKAQATEVLKAEMGPQYDANMALVKRAFARFSDPETTKAINDSGLGNNPLFIKLFHRIGKEIAEGPFIDSHSTPVVKPTAAEIMYPEMKKKD